MATERHRAERHRAERHRAERHRAECVDRAFVINVAAATHRMARASAELAREGLEFERFDAVTSSPPGNPDVHASCALACTAGALGCALSHRGVWREVVTRGYRAALVLEDDVALAKGFRAGLCDALARVPPDFDVLLVGYSRADRHPTFSVMDLAAREAPPGFLAPKAFYGMHAYVVSQKGARELLRHKVVFQVDIQASLLPGLKLYALETKLAHQAADDSYVAPRSFPVVLNRAVRVMEVPGLNLFGLAGPPTWMWLAALALVSARVPRGWLVAFFALEATVGGVTPGFVVGLVVTAFFSATRA